MGQGSSAFWTCEPGARGWRGRLGQAAGLPGPRSRQPSEERTSCIWPALPWGHQVPGRNWARAGRGAMTDLLDQPVAPGPLTVFHFVAAVPLSGAWFHPVVCVHQKDGSRESTLHELCLQFTPIASPLHPSPSSLGPLASRAGHRARGRLSSSSEGHGGAGRDWYGAIAAPCCPGCGTEQEKKTRALVLGRVAA